MTDNEDMKSDEMPDPKEAKKTKKAPKKDKDEARVNNSIEINPKLEEAVSRTVVFSFGRMNPVTIGHEKLVNKVVLEAKKNNATPVVYLSHSQDAKKNPLSYNDKVSIAQKAFGKIIKKSNAKTIIQVMQELAKSFDKAILIVGEDRVKEFETLLNRYNGKDYNFDNITVMSAGARDPDAEGVEGMSASKMRAAAASGDKEAFISGLPKKLKRSGDDVYDMVRSGMKLAEELEELGLLGEALDHSQRRQRAITMRKYKSKIAMARKRMSKRPATPEKIKNRAQKKALAIVKAKVAGKKGADYSSLSTAEKQMIDKKVQKRKALIQRLAKKLVPKVRQADRAKLSGKKKSVNEEFELFLEKRHHQARNKDGSIKLDKRFRAFRGVKEDAEDILKKQHKQERINMSKEHERENDALKARTMRKQIRDLKRDDNEVKESFEFDESILSLIEEISEDIHNSVLLDESKAIRGLAEKAEKSGIPIEAIQEAYNRGIDAWEEADTDETPQQWGYARVNSLIAGGKKDSDLLEEVDLNSFFDLNEQFDLLEATMLDKALAAIHKHVSAGADVGDMSYQVSRAAGVNFSSRELKKKYLEKFGKAKATSKDLDDRIQKFKSRPKRKFGMYQKEEHGAGFEGTDTLIQNYKSDTPGESGTKKKAKISDWSPYIKDKKAKNVNEAFEDLMEAECQLIGMKQIKEFEKVVDKLFAKFGIDFKFTRHFGDRMSDERNTPCITLKELADFIKKIYANQGKSLKGVAGAEAVIKDIQKDLNIPVAVEYDARNDEFDVVMKTIMRKKNFKTPNKVITYK